MNNLWEKLFISAIQHSEEFKVGEIIIKVLHTPGHTIESTTYLLIDSNSHFFNFEKGLDSIIVTVSPACACPFSS